MAPVNEHAVATVYSTEVRSADERRILVERGNFTPTRWFLEHVAKAASESVVDTEPPKKRRKIREEPDISHASFDDEELIPIHKVTLDLHFAETLQTRPVGSDAIRNDVEFDGSSQVCGSFFGIQEDGDSSRLRLTTPKKKGAVLIVDCTLLPEPARDALRHVAFSTRSVLERTGAKSTSAVEIRCSLKRSIGQLYNVIRLESTIFWRSGVSAFAEGVPARTTKVYEVYNLLTQVYHDKSRDAVDHSQPWTPQEFYESLHVPDKELDTPQNEIMLESELYPFQKRAVAWMLAREGVKYDTLAAETYNGVGHVPSSIDLFEPIEDADGRKCYVNYLQGIISRDQPAAEKLSGGVLAEEMGLGKTVELMALVSVNKRPNITQGKVADEFSGTAVTPSKATLIITPSSILQQWRAELSRHAPALKVYQYDGIPNGSGSKKAPSNEELLRRLSTEYDVVLATYQTLGREIHFAEDPPDRNMRHVRKFERKRSPLVQIQWWRICLDEAQMVESGVTAAARVACRLPRIHSWAVSGTPLRKNWQDLHGLLIFLRYKPFSDDARLWSHLITNHRHIFKRMFGHIALRHTKAQIREELRLPPQKRVVLTVPFSAVEQQHYSTLFTQMCEDVGLTADGAPVGEHWDPDDPNTNEAMRNWLVRLRQTCLHPQVGGRNRRALGRGQGPLRTVAEVLEVMIEQNETQTRVEERAVLASKLLRAHIIGNNRADEHRSEKALVIYENAMSSSANLVEEARERLAKAKASLAEKGEAATDSEDDDSSSESSPVLGRLPNNLRTALQLEHVCTFFAATAYFQIKTNESLTPPDSDRFKELEEQESALYERAKALRKEILQDTSRKAEVIMRKIEDASENGKFTRMPSIRDLELGGIKGRRITEKSDELFDVIRGLAEVIVKWRAKMAEYLLKPLVDEDEEGKETTGDEYEDSTKLQDELYVYFDAIKAIQADLNTFVTGEDAPLIDHEVKTLMRDAKWFLDPNIDFDAVVHAPELLLELLAVRNKFRAQRDRVASVRALIQEARTLENAMQFGSARAESERLLAKQHLTALQRVFTDYSKALSGLEKEVELFRSSQNQRIEFYRQLQELSDAVAPHKEELDETLDIQALQNSMTKEEQQEKSLAQLKTKHRFLLHLRDESGTSNAPKICVICQSPFENGVLTVCGHQYCKECIQHWWSQHRTCPVCKRKLALVDFHNITYKPKEFKAQEEAQSGSSSPGSEASSISLPTHQVSIYTDIDSKLADEIKSVDLPSSYGSKIDAVGRHLHWIREHDPGAKSIVFSQYREFLDVLGTALHEFKIGYSRLGRSGAVEKFRHDASVDCLLLDAKTDSSGLTLVNATHVFICEPLIQTAVELQAIARVHRIGQTRPTTVWMYLINDTVEEAIYEISVARRLAHVQSRQSGNGKSRSTTPAPLQETAIDAANSEELQSAPLSKLLVAGKGGGELVGNDDLWRCLFGKTQKTTAKPSVEAETEVGRHLRAEAAEQRRIGG